MFWKKKVKAMETVEIANLKGGNGKVDFKLNMRSAPEEHLRNIVGVHEKGDYIIFSAEGGGAIVAKHDFISAVII